MANSDVITEKVYCHDAPSNDNALLTACLSGNMGNQWNNPMMLLWAMIFGGGGFGWDRNRNGLQDAEIQSKLNSITNQMTDNQNTNLLRDAIAGNHGAIHEIATMTNSNFRDVLMGVSNVNAVLERIGGQIGFSSEKVLNGIIIGNKDLQSMLQSCCCENKQLVQKMGYENQLSIKDQTYTINERLTGIANGLQKGFSDLGYILAQNKGDLINNQNAVGQRIVDTLNNHWTTELSQRLQDAKFENSQLKQNQYLVSALGGGNCNC